MICILSLVFSNAVFAVEDTDYLSLFGLVEDENKTIESLDYKIANMKYDVESAYRSSKSMLNRLEDLADIGYRPKDLMLEGMLYVVEVVPTQVEYGLFALQNTRDVTVKSLETGVRQMVTGVMSAENTYEMAVIKADFYKSEYDNATLSYDLGRISKTELLKAETTYFEAEINMNSAARNLSDSNYSLNNLIGYDLEESYEIRRETMFDMELKPASEYIEEALLNRFEIKDITEKMLVEIVKREHYEFRNFLDFKTVRDKYDDSAREVLLLENELEVVEQNITEDIFSAVNDIQSLELQIAQLEATLDMQKNNYNTLLAQKEQGNLVESAIKELEFAIMDIENNLDVMAYSYNTKRYQLYNATQLGPAYGGGM